MLDQAIDPCLRNEMEVQYPIQLDSIYVGRREIRSDGIEDLVVG